MTYRLQLDRCRERSRWVRVPPRHTIRWGAMTSFAQAPMKLRICGCFPPECLRAKTRQATDETVVCSHVVHTGVRGQFWELVITTGRAYSQAINSAPARTRGANRASAPLHRWTESFAARSSQSGPRQSGRLRNIAPADAG